MNITQLFIRGIEAKDNIEIAHIIRTVMTQLGACGPGFSINDSEVDQIFETYQKPGHAYFVITDGTSIYGGGGIGPLVGSNESICELKKMYFTRELRGHGFGQKLIDTCLLKAKSLGYAQCYLETLKTMTAAINLYKKNRFVEISGPLGDTGHFSCDCYFLRKISH